MAHPTPWNVQLYQPCLTSKIHILILIHGFPSSFESNSEAFSRVQQDISIRKVGEPFVFGCSFHLPTKQENIALWKINLTLHAAAFHHFRDREPKLGTGEDRLQNLERINLLEKVSSHFKRYLLSTLGQVDR